MSQIGKCKLCDSGCCNCNECVNIKGFEKDICYECSTAYLKDVKKFSAKVRTTIKSFPFAKEWGDHDLPPDKVLSQIIHLCNAYQNSIHTITALDDRLQKVKEIVK